MQIRLWQEVIWWNLGAGRESRARELAHRYAVFARPASREQAFFLRVEAIPEDFE